jgi:hypothetical protein
MKTNKTTTAKKLLTRFDHELRDLLLNDLMRFTFNQPLLNGNIRAMTQSTLSVA